uniref:Uncharacterized protein n=1 Tax=Avena sativa TaxID=4498 RepID=A0ACD5V810_AVESA
MARARVALCLAALLAMSLLSTSTHAAGRNIGTTGGGGPTPAPPTAKCILAKGCAPTDKPSSDIFCQLYCLSTGYNLFKSYCKPDKGGTCCCVK